MLVIEFLVLALIAYEVGGAVLGKRRTRQRLMVIRGLLVKGQALQIGRAHIFTPVPTCVGYSRPFGCSLLKGQALQQRAPKGPGITDAGRDWGKDVDLWEQETSHVLDSYSSQAVASFMYDSGIVGTVYPWVADSKHYAGLVLHLQNLKSIMEKPDIYL